MKINNCCLVCKWAKEEHCDKYSNRLKERRIADLFLDKNCSNFIRLSKKEVSI